MEDFMDSELSLDNISFLDDDELSNTFNMDSEEKESDEKNEQTKETKEETTEVNADELFSSEEEPESVGSEEKNIKEKEDTIPKGNGSSPEYIYSSIAKALKEEGIFPDLEDDVFSQIKQPEDFRDLIDKQIKAGLDERQKRIDEALNYGLEGSEIKKYENTISYFESINQDVLNSENNEGENLRKQLIYQDYINRGFSKERATREVKRSFDSGSDLEDAKEALESNINFFKNKYEDLIKEAKEQTEQEEKERKQQAEKLKNLILNDQKVFGDLTIDKSTRQKVYDNLIKPVYKDPETGEYYTAIQKYEKNNRMDFLKNLSLVFTLTDGFKNLDRLVKGKVRKEVKKGLRELENTLNNTARTSDGSLNFISGVSEDPESFIGKDWDLDV